MTLQVYSLKVAEKHLPRYILLCSPSVKHVQELSRPEPVAAANTRQSANFLILLGCSSVTSRSLKTLCCSLLDLKRVCRA